MTIEIRPVSEDEFPPYAKAVSRGFGGHLPDGQVADLRKITNLSRTLAAFDGDLIVGTNNSRLWQISVPGGSMPVAGIDGITVPPTHRRRGILTRMMDLQLRDLHERGEAVAALYAAESVIYGRFGFGVVTIEQTLSFDRRHASFTPPFEQRGQVRFVEPDEMRESFPDIQRRALENRPGVIQTPDYEWDKRRESSTLETSKQPRFNAVYEVDGRADGSVRFTNDTWGEQLVSVEELMAVTDEAYSALWKFVLGIDLIETIKAPGRPIDDPIFWMLDDPQRLGMSTYARGFDSLWIRLVDVPVALASRKYRTTDRLTLDVRDSFCPWNEEVYELNGSYEGSECTRTNATPDIVLSASDLAACYLGTVKFSTLAHAGRVKETTQGALVRADMMFESELAPWCPFTF